MRRKRDSKRRWKARYRLGKEIPWFAVVEHDLEEFVRRGYYHINRDTIRNPW